MSYAKVSTFPTLTFPPWPGIPLDLLRPIIPKNLVNTIPRMGLIKEIF